MLRGGGSAPPARDRGADYRQFKTVDERRIPERYSVESAGIYLSREHFAMRNLGIVALAVAFGWLRFIGVGHHTELHFAGPIFILQLSAVGA